MDLGRHRITDVSASSQGNAFLFIPQRLPVSIKSFPHYKIGLQTPCLAGDQDFGFWRVFSRIWNGYPNQQCLCSLVQTQNPLAQAVAVIERRDRQSCMLAGLVDRTCLPLSSWFYGTMVDFYLLWTRWSFMLILLLLLSYFSFLYFENNFKDIAKYLWHTTCKVNIMHCGIYRYL